MDMIETMKKMQEIVGGVEYPGGYENYAVAVYHDKIIFNGNVYDLTEENVNKIFKRINTSLMFVLTESSSAYQETTFLRNRNYNFDKVLEQTINDYDSEKIVACLKFIQMLKICIDLIHNKGDNSMHYIYFYTEEYSITYYNFKTYNELEKEYQELEKVMGD